MKTTKIKGQVVYKHLGPGFWGIVSNNGKEYRPVNMPEQLKHEGKEVEVSITEVEEDASIFMWGIPVKITGFSTLSP